MRTFEELEREVRRIAAERADFVYVRSGGNRYCMYLHYEDGVPVGDCLFGQALINLGVEPASLVPLETKDIGRVMISLGIKCSIRQFDWAYNLQQCQDKGMTWGECVRRADEEFPL